MPLQVKCGVHETALVQPGSKTCSLLSSIVPVPLERPGAAQGLLSVWLKAELIPGLLAPPEQQSRTGGWVT